MQLFSYNPHPFNFLACLLFRFNFLACLLLSLFFFSFFFFLFFPSVFIAFPISLACFYCFDDVGLAFLGQICLSFLLVLLCLVYLFRSTCLDAMLECLLALISLSMSCFLSLSHGQGVDLDLLVQAYIQTPKFNKGFEKESFLLVWLLTCPSLLLLLDPLLCLHVQIQLLASLPCFTCFMLPFSMYLFASCAFLILLGCSMFVHVHPCLHVQIQLLASLPCFTCFIQSLQYVFVLLPLLLVLLALYHHVRFSCDWLHPLHTYFLTLLMHVSLLVCSCLQALLHIFSLFACLFTCLLAPSHAFSTCLFVSMSPFFCLSACLPAFCFLSLFLCLFAGFYSCLLHVRTEHMCNFEDASKRVQISRLGGLASP